MIGRRALAAAGLALAAARARAQSGGVPVVAFLGFASGVTDLPSVDALRQGFTEIGYVEGRNYRLELRHAEGALDRVPALIAELLALNVAVFVVPGQAAARILSRATRAPVVAIGLPPSPGEPPLYASLARPGGTVTGFSDFVEELAGKRIELLREVMPELRAVGILHNSVDPVFRAWGEETEAAARRQGLGVIRLGLTGVDPGETERLIRTLRPAGAHALVIVRDFLTQSVRDVALRVAIEERVASVTEHRDNALLGAFMCYGADHADLFRRAAGYVDRILRGDRPGDLPIQLATRLQLIINLRTARAIGIEVPPGVLLRADEVIE